MLFSIVSMILYIMTKISVNLYSGSLFIKMALGWNTYSSVGLLLVMTAVMTMIGGLAAVMYTDAAQALIMIVGSVSLTFIALTDTNSWSPEQFKAKFYVKKM